MAILLIFTLFISHLSLKTESLKPQCPQLTFPHSSLPTNFQFICEHNKTAIHFKSYGELIVKSISYDNPRKLDLVDPQNCVHRVFFNLNLSLTPFDYYYAVKDFTYLNCSALLLPASHEPVPCLSGPGYSVYVVEPGFEVPGFCRAMRTVRIPFGYSDYLDDDSFGLGLTWDLNRGGPSCRSGPTCSNGAHKTVLCISVFIFMVAMMMIGAKIYCSKKLDMNHMMNGIKRNRLEVDDSLGDFEAL